MKRRSIRQCVTIIGVLASIFVGGSGSFASVSLEQEYPGFSWYIPTYEVDMKLRKDGVLSVTERIVADFSDTSRRGIIRDIPYKYRDLINGKSRVTPLTIESVTGFSGAPWEYKVSSNGDYKSIRVGNADIFYSEPLNYEIKYEVENLINSFGPDGEVLGELSKGNDSAVDELFWNAIGTQWDESPIGFFEVTMDLSEFSSDEILLVECFTGEFGSTNGCNLQRDGQIYTASSPLLGYKSGVTFDVEIEGGVIVPEWSWKVLMYDLVKLLFFVPFLMLFGCYMWWRRHGKELPGKSVIPTYKLDAELRAMEVGALVDEKFNNEDITAGLVDMAVKGFIEIKEIPKKGMFGKKSFEFIRKKDYENSDLEEFEKELLRGMFGRGERVNSKDLEGVFYITVNKVKKKVFEFLVDQNYYVKNPNSVTGKYIGIGSFILFGSVWLSAFIGNWYLLPVLIPLGLGLLMIGPFMSKKTKHGVDVYTHILGFKEFIKVAEKDRVKFFQEYKDELSKDDQIRTFEKLLPFAIAYGMGDKWADLFGDMLVDYGYNPVWYNGGGDFRMNNLSSGISEMGRTVRAAAAPPSNSASSGGSSGGGGFSGGGFGGGGGSSW